MKQIASALLEFHKNIGKIRKDATNPFFKNKYASLPNILEQITPVLCQCGLVLVQQPEGVNGLKTILIEVTSGETLESTYIMTPAKNDPQGLGSAISYQRRYAIASILSLSIDDDDDANEASKPESKFNGTAIKAPLRNDKGLPVMKEATDAFRSAITKISKGETTMEYIKTKMEVPKEVEDKIMSVVNAMQPA